MTVNQLKAKFGAGSSSRIAKNRSTVFVFSAFGWGFVYRAPVQMPPRPVQAAGTPAAKHFYFMGVLADPHS